MSVAVATIPAMRMKHARPAVRAIAHNDTDPKFTIEMAKMLSAYAVLHGELPSTDSIPSPSVSFAAVGNLPTRSFWDDLGHGLGDVVHTVTDTVDNVANTVANTVTDTVDTVANTVGNAVDGAVGSLTNVAASALAGTKPTINQDIPLADGFVLHLNANVDTSVPSFSATVTLTVPIVSMFTGDVTIGNCNIGAPGQRCEFGYKDILQVALYIDGNTLKLDFDIAGNHATINIISW